jgi:hypothetical protein
LYEAHQRGSAALKDEENYWAQDTLQALLCSFTRLIFDGCGLAVNFLLMRVIFIATYSAVLYY